MRGFPMKLAHKDIIKRSFTLMDGPSGYWFAAELPQYLGHRQIFVAMGSPFGYSGGRTIDGDAWALLLDTSALDFAESRAEFVRSVEMARVTVKSEHNTTHNFWQRMKGLTPRPCAPKWRAVQWVDRAEKSTTPRK